MPTQGLRNFFHALTCAAMLTAGAAQAQSNPVPTTRLRGTLEAVTADSLTMKTRSGKSLQLALPPNTPVSETYPIQIDDIKPGSFIGSGAMPQPDGSQRALAVTVFPESARGTGEGHYPFDAVPHSTMTNATVAEVTSTPGGRKLVVRYKGGEKTIIVPPDAPIVTFRPGDRSLLVPGASIGVTAREVDGKLVAQRISAGRNGFQLPY
jgi:hypothetical protein